MGPNIDYKLGILYDVLERQAPEIDNEEPLLKQYWVCEIDPKESCKLLSLIKSRFQYTSEELKNLKRMYKIKNANGDDVLRVLVCPVEDDSDENYTVANLQNILREKLLNRFTITKHSIPINKPFDKEHNQLWSEKYWPLLWKGNPLIQELNELYKSIDIKKIQKYMKLVGELSTVCNSKAPIVTIFVDPRNDEIKSIKHDTRAKNDPIDHSIMNCISEIAQQESERRHKQAFKDKSSNNYLCLDYHVYTSHEPCTMCSMALVHSRISQLVYLKPSPKTGGIGKNSGNKEMIHISCSLNWKFEAFHYQDENLNALIKSMPEDLYI